MADHAATVRGMFEAWNEHRQRDTVGLFHQDIVLDARGLPQPDFSDVYRGIEEYGRWTVTWLGGFEHIEQHPVWVEQSGDRVASWVHLVGRFKTTGIDFDEHGGWIFDFRDGKVGHIRLMTDEDETRAMLDADV